MNEINKLGDGAIRALSDTETRLIAIPPELEMPPLRSAARQAVDVDFSLAIHNRTGKYFIGEELLSFADLPLGKTYYWWQAAERPLEGFYGRVMGRLQHWQILGKTVGGPLGWLPRRMPKRPLLHLDPFTVPTTVLRPIDAVLIHDLGPLTHPSLFPQDVCAIYRHIYDEIARVGPHLVFVSHTSRKEFEALYPGSIPHSSRIIHPPIRPGIGVGEAMAVEGVEPPFLLTVGSVGSRKNQARSIAAYARSGLAERGVRYVICGGREPGYEEVEEIAKRTPGVHLLSYVSDAELRWLYTQASGFVLMSLLEGFGMPVGEAVRHRLIPLVSRGGVLREVAGEGALEADPDDIMEIAARMAALVDMQADERRERLAKLEVTIERFDIAHFHKGWKGLFLDMLSAR